MWLPPPRTIIGKYGQPGDPRWDDDPATANVYFHPLERSDFQNLLRWRNAPHVVPWFPDCPRDLNDVEKKFGPRIDGSIPIHVFVMEVYGHAVGYLQYEVLEAGGVTLADIDFLIGELAYVGRGLGARAITEFIDFVELVAEPHVEKIVAQPDARNTRSLRVLEKAGFQIERTFEYAGTQRRLCVLNLE